MPDKNPPAFPPGDFFVRKTACDRYTCKNEHPGQGRRWTDFRSRFLYLHIVFLALLPVFCKEHMWAGTPVKTNTPDRAGGCYPHASDFRIAMLSRRPGGFLRAVCVRQPDLDSGGHFRRDGLSPGSSPSGRGGGILPDQLQSGGISV